MIPLLNAYSYAANASVAQAIFGFVLADVCCCSDTICCVGLSTIVCVCGNHHLEPNVLLDELPPLLPQPLFHHPLFEEQSSTSIVN